VDVSSTGLGRTCDTTETNVLLLGVKVPMWPRKGEDRGVQDREKSRTRIAC
jgi:hypothetical protein